MTDKEILELAAKAAGYRIRVSDEGSFDIDDGQYWVRWNPLSDDGQALRLAVQLKVAVSVWFLDTTVESDDCESVKEDHGNDPYAATRRAIVRAAAAIGESMP